MASTFAERRILRRIPSLRSLSSHALEDIQERMVYHSYQAGDVIWRTRGPLRFSGYLQSGEIELEFRVSGILVRTTRLHPGDLLPPRALRERRLHELVIARAVTDVRLAILPEPHQAHVQTTAMSHGPRWMNWLWPVLLVLLLIILARDDIIRITSSSLYLAASQGEGANPNDSRPMSLLRAARNVDQGAAFAYNEEGYLWFQQDQLSEATSSFHNALTKDPTNASALNNLAITYFIQGNPKQSATYLQQAVEQAPDNPIPRYNLGIAMMQIHEPAGALQEFREAGFIDPQAAWPQLQQAFLYQQNGEFANAEQRARTTIQLNPSLVPAHLLLGMALYNQGKEAEALPSFTRVLALDPGNRVAAFYQALILGHQKQYDTALPILQRLIISSTDISETIRILMEINALERFKAEPAAAGP